MSMDNDIGEELLFAYLDGELDPAQRARVEAALARDPALAATLATQQQLQARLQAQFDPVLGEAVPERLLAAAAAPAASVTDLGAVRATRKARHTPRWSWREWGAMAATLVLGLLLGLALRHGNEDRSLVAGTQGLVAAGTLATALSTQPAGSVPHQAGARIGFSIRTMAGQYCRTFTLASGPTGLACRRNNQWMVDVLAIRNTTPTGTFRQAGSGMPEPLRLAIEQRMAGDPLTAAEEQARIREQWRPATASTQQ